MKKIIIYLILCFMAVVVFGQTNVPAIVVSTFSARGQAVSADDAESITELFIAELANQSGVRVVDRTSIERVVSEMRFQTSDWSNPQKTTQLGAALNAEYLVRGQINQLGQQVTVSITALDINTLEIVSSSTKTFEVNRIFGNDKYNSGRYMETNIFGAMPDIASGIASPIKTKMNQLAEQRKKEQEEREKQQQEQAKLQEQNRYSLNRTWYIGDNMTRISDSFSEYDAKFLLSSNRWDSSSSLRKRLIFNTNGTFEVFYEKGDSSYCEYYHLSGYYTRKDDKLDFSLSGSAVEAYAISSSWYSRNGYSKVDYRPRTVNNFTGYATIQFTNNGNGIIINSTSSVLNGTYTINVR